MTTPAVMARFRRLAATHRGREDAIGSLPAPECRILALRSALRAEAGLRGRRVGQTALRHDGIPVLAFARSERPMLRAWTTNTARCPSVRTPRRAVVPGSRRILPGRTRTGGERSRWR